MGGKSFDPPFKKSDSPKITGGLKSQPGCKPLPPAPGEEPTEGRSRLRPKGLKPKSGGAGRREDSPSPLRSSPRTPGL